MTELATILLLLLAAALCAFLLWRRRARSEALLADLSEAVALAAEAEQLYWRTERRYAGDLATLSGLRPKLGDLLASPALRQDTKWTLAAAQDGSKFELVACAVPVERRGELRGYRDVMVASGARGSVSFDTFADAAERLPRPRGLTRAAARG